MEMFEQRLKSIREHQNMTQTELACVAGLTPAAISQFEAGIRKPSHKSLKKLSKALKVTTDHLIGKKEYDIDDLLSDPRALEIADGWNDLSDDQKQALFYQYEFLAHQQGIPLLV